MQTLRTAIAAIGTIAILAACPAPAAGQTGDGVVRGQVTDASGGVLPGVTVAATTTDGRIVASSVTDGSGVYAFAGLPAGSITLTFHLDGFANAAVATTVRPGAESQAAVRLTLASLSETVLVQAPRPVDPPLLAAKTLPPPPMVRPVPAHNRDSVCGPAKPGALPESVGTISARRNDAPGRLYSTGAELIIDRGLNDGLEVGRNLVVRHYYRARGAAGADAVAEHSAGLLQIVEVGERSSVAVVVYACDELRLGDFLAVFAPEQIREPEPSGTPAYADPARILFADEGQTLGAPRRLMVIDRGTDRGTHVGQRFTLFRHSDGAVARENVGDAVVVAARSDSATIRIEHVTDVIMTGDWAAPQYPSSAANRPR